MPKKGSKKQFCIRNHNVSIMGRDKSGHCIVCQKEDHAIYQLEIKEGKRIRQHTKQFCLYGHDTFICGRSKHDNCISCNEERYKENYVPHLRVKKQFCRKGHDVFICGRDDGGNCNDCRLEARKRYNEKNFEQIKIRTKKYAENHKKEYKNNKLKRIYGITLQDYTKIFEQQNGECLGCNLHQSQLNRSLDIDHDHISGKVRGLLCRPCNLIIGLAKDNSILLRQLANYLKK